MNTTFGSGSSVDFPVQDPQAVSGTVRNILEEIPNFVIRRHIWYADEGSGRFNVMGGFEDSTERLQLLAFHWEVSDSSVFEVMMSPQRLIKALGIPNHIFIATGPVGTPYPPIADMLIVYESGVVFRSISFMSEQTGANGQVVGILCLNNTDVHQEGYFIFGDVIIVGPFRQGLVELSPLQRAIIEVSSPVYDLEPIEEALGISPETIAQLVQQEQNTCLRIE